MPIDGANDPAYNGKWVDELHMPNESTMVISPGSGYFFSDRAPSGFVWSYPR